LNFIIKTFLINLLLFILSACNNSDKLELSKQNEASDTHEIDLVKQNQKNEIDSLRDTISLLEKKKKNILSKNKFDLLEAEIYSILKNSYFDLIIIGTKNIDVLSKLFNTKLGFVLKKGRLHKNGISNNFIEFENNSEIEFIEVKNPTDKISSEYSSMINHGKQALQFAVRVNEIGKLENNLDKLESDFNKFDSNLFYSTLSSPNINLKLPIFFIQYKRDNNNTLTKHPNKSKGISAIWFATKDIRETAKTLTDFGFSAINKINIDGLGERKILFSNNNFDIILIESDVYKIQGISVNVEDIILLKSILSKNFGNKFSITRKAERQSIFISPTYTESIWIEFFEVV